MRSVNTLVVAILLAAGAPGLLAQANPTGGAKVAPPAPAKASPHASKPTAKAKAKPAAPKPVETSAPAADSQTPAEGDKLARRDPFESLVNKDKGGAGKNLPPGKAGLQVSTLRLDGIVRSSNGMIAVV